MAKKAKIKKNQKLDYSLAAAVSGRVDIQDVRLISSNCYQAPEALASPKSLDIDVEVHVDTDRKNGLILVFPVFKLHAFQMESDMKDPALTIEAQLLLVYKAETLAGLKQENFKVFGDTNGVYNAWPYWREFVQNTAARMGLPPLTIPVFRLVKPKEISTKKRKKTKK